MATVRLMLPATGAVIEVLLKAMGNYVRAGWTEAPPEPPKPPKPPRPRPQAQEKAAPRARKAASPQAGTQEAGASPDESKERQQ